MGPDLESKRWIVAKGILFAALAMASAALLLIADFPPGQRALLLGICIWASCRGYYFVFHVLHFYVDPTLPAAGISDLVKHLLRRRP